MHSICLLVDVVNPCTMRMDATPNKRRSCKKRNDLKLLPCISLLRFPFPVIFFFVSAKLPLMQYDASQTTSYTLTEKLWCKIIISDANRTNVIA